MKQFYLAFLACVTTACLPLVAAADSDISRVNGSVHVTAQSPVGDVETVNGSIRIDGGVVAKNVETVNGSIEIGERASVDRLHTVNGAISLGQGATASKIDTVNGRMTLAEGARVKGSVSATNGSTSLARNAEIGGGFSNTNGKISLDNARIQGGIKTTSGDILVGSGSSVTGDIVIEKPGMPGLNWSRHKKPTVIIGPNATVTGTLRAEQEIDLYVSNRATIGTVTGAKAIMFTGDEPSAAEMAVEK
jgi:DUF4097 and DUF4098 domain-containing protein YvlB